MISKFIIILVDNFSRFTISLDYPFIPLCISLILIFISYCIIFDNLEKRYLTIILAFLNLILVGIISYQFSNINKFKIDVLNSGDFIISDKKENLIILKSEDLKKLKKYMHNNTFIINLNKNLVLDYNKVMNLGSNNIYSLEFKDKKFEFIGFKIKEKCWIKIKILDTILLFCIDGGEVNDLPEKFRSCDIFISFKLPNNFNKLNFKKIVFADNSWLKSFNFNKITNYNNSISNGDAFSVFISSNNNYYISRKF